MRTRRQSWIAMIAAAILATACASTDPGITAKVRTKMAMDETVRPYRIEVTTENGVVTLTGNIDSQDAKDKAVALAKLTKGVVEVKDMIAVRRPTGDGDAPEPERTVGVAIDDASTTVRVKDRLFGDPTVKGLRIDVDTRDGVVYLTGPVASDAERQLAIRLARETKGVKDVRANLTIEKG